MKRPPVKGKRFDMLKAKLGSGKTKMMKEKC